MPVRSLLKSHPLDAIQASGGPAITVTISDISGSGTYGQDIQIDWTGTLPAGSYFDINQETQVSATPIPIPTGSAGIATLVPPSPDVLQEDVDFVQSPGFFNFYTVFIKDSSNNTLATSNTLIFDIP